jgi:hypothetical protein
VWGVYSYRLDKMTRDEKLHFMKQNGLSYVEVCGASAAIRRLRTRAHNLLCCPTQATPQEIETRQRQLKAVRDAATIDLKQRTAPLPTYFKVPFTEALDLVRLNTIYSRPSESLP